MGVGLLKPHVACRFVCAAHHRHDRCGRPVRYFGLVVHIGHGLDEPALPASGFDDGLCVWRGAAQLDALAFAALEAKREIVETATPEKLAQLNAQLDSLKANTEPELDKMRQRVQHYEGKLNSPAIGPKSLREYEQSIDKINAAISSIELEIQQAAKAVEVCHAALEGGSAMLEALDQEISAARAGTTAPISAETPPWLTTLAAQAGRPVELGGLSSGEGLINAIRDAREVRLPDGSVVAGAGSTSSVIGSKSAGASPNASFAASRSPWWSSCTLAVQASNMPLSGSLAWSDCHRPSLFGIGRTHGAPEAVGGAQRRVFLSCQ